MLLVLVAGGVLWWFVVVRRRWREYTWAVRQVDRHIKLTQLVGEEGDYELLLAHIILEKYRTKRLLWALPLFWMRIRARIMFLVTKEQECRQAKERRSNALL